MSDKKAPRKRSDFMVCELNTEGGVGGQVGPVHHSRTQVEKWITKNFDDSEGKTLLIVRAIRRVKIIHKRETVVNVAVEDAPPV